MGPDDKNYVCTVTLWLNQTILGQILVLHTRGRHMLHGFLRVHLRDS